MRGFVSRVLGMRLAFSAGFSLGVPFAGVKPSFARLRAKLFSDWSVVELYYWERFRVSKWREDAPIGAFTSVSSAKRYGQLEHESMISRIGVLKVDERWRWNYRNVSQTPV